MEFDVDLFTLGKLNRQLLSAVGWHQVLQSSFIWHPVIGRCATNSETRGGGFIDFPISEESPNPGNCKLF